MKKRPRPRFPVVWDPEAGLAAYRHSPTRPLRYAEHILVDPDTLTSRATIDAFVNALTAPGANPIKIAPGAGIAIPGPPTLRTESWAFMRPVFTKPWQAYFDYIYADGPASPRPLNLGYTNLNQDLAAEQTGVSMNVSTQPPSGASINAPLTSPTTQAGP